MTLPVALRGYERRPDGATRDAGWSERVLSEVCDVNPRGWLLQDLPDDTEATFVPMSAVSETTASIEVRDVRRVVEVRRGYTAFAENDVLFAKITPCMENGKAALATGLRNGIGFGSTEFHVLRAKAGNEPKFIHYLVRQPRFRDAAKQTMRGGVGQQRVPEDFVKRYRVNLPLPSEQRRIVEILDQADALRTLRAEADAKAERILPALFYKMFGDPATWSPGCTLPLGELVNVLSGATPSKANPEYWVGPIPWISPKDMKTEVLTDAEDHISQQALDETNLKLIPMGAVLIVVRGMILARAVPVAITRTALTINQDMKALLAKDDRVNGWYIYTLLRVLGRHLLAAVGTAAHGTRKLDTDLLLSTAVLVPDYQRCVRFREATEQALELVAQQRERHGKLDTLFAVLLHRAFSGDLTTKWREAHMQELLVEMEQQAKELERSGSGAGGV